MVVLSQWFFLRQTGNIPVHAPSLLYRSAESVSIIGAIKVTSTYEISHLFTPAALFQPYDE